MLHACNTGEFTEFSSDKVMRGHVCILGHVTCLEASRIFYDGYFVTVCVSLSFWMEQPSHRVSCFHWSMSVFVSRRSLSV